MTRSWHTGDPSPPLTDNPTDSGPAVRILQSAAELHQARERAAGRGGEIETRGPAPPPPRSGQATDPSPRYVELGGLRPPPQLPATQQASRRHRRCIAWVALGLALAAVGGVVAGGPLDDRHAQDVRSSHPIRNSSPVTLPATSSPPTTTSPASDQRIAVSSAAAFDPLGDSQEDDADLPKLYDGDPSAAWQTDTYSNRQFGNLKSGVGYVLNLDGSHLLHTLLLVSATPDYDVRVYVSDSAGTTLGAWGRPVASLTDVGGQVSLPLRGQLGSHLLVWFTRLSPSDEVQIGEAQVGET